METTLTLHNYWRSSASHRVRIALGLKGLAYQYRSVHLVKDGGQNRQAEYRAMNPMAQVPTLEVQDGDERRFLPQSLPIMEYLEERWPLPRLLPEDPFLRAHTRALAELVNSGIQPFQNLPVLRRVSALGGDDKAWIRAFMSEGLAAFEQLSAAHRGAFCVGDSPTIADCCLIPQLYAARRFDVDLTQLSALVAIEERCAALPAFAAAAPAQQPDATP
jgi:maleylpyruvate isomerase